MNKPKGGSKQAAALFCCVWIAGMIKYFQKMLRGGGMGWSEL